MYQAITDEMDLNCGLIVEGESTVDESGEVNFQKILDTASSIKERATF